MLPAKIVLPIYPNSFKNKRTASSSKKIADLYIYLGNQIIPIQKEPLYECELIKEHLKRNRKIILILQNLNTAMFMKIIRYFHGEYLQLAKMSELSDFLDCADYIGATKLLEDVQSDIEKDIQNYDIFCLIQLAYKFGLQRIFDLCLWYLQLDQFEQIRYNKFDFLQCDFVLAQIILRRHHFLKLKGKIQGLDIAEIQQVIGTYCYRNKIDNQTKQRLLWKYVKSIQNFKFVKNSLRLQKLAHKNIFQSANMEMDQFENNHKTEEELCNIVVNSFRNSKRLQHTNEIVEQMFQPLKQNEDDQSISFVEMSNHQGHLNIEQSKEQYQIKVQYKNQPDENQKIRKQTHQLKNNNILNIENVEQADLMASKISTLLNQYESAFKEHEAKFQNLRKNARSMLIDNGHNQQGQQNTKLVSSSRLSDNSNLMFTIYIPNQ